MRLTNNVPTEAGIYLVGHASDKGVYIPCLVGKTGTGQVYLQVPGREDSRMIHFNKDVSWIGPFTVEDLMDIPDSEGSSDNQQNGRRVARHR